jgi:hypothetical protein
MTEQKFYLSRKIFVNRYPSLDIGFTVGMTRGCLLPLGTWSYLWYIQGLVKTLFLICISYRIYD